MGIIIKTAEQIEGIRKSCELAVDTLDWIKHLIQPGISTEHINLAAESYIRSHGGTPAPLGYHGYPKATCTSLNEVICHGIPKEDDVLKDGDIIKVDVATILNGYYGDTCQTFAVGTISEEAKALISVAQDCLAIGVSQVRPGVPFGNIGKAITNYATYRGMSVVWQFAGHGVGLELHEEPHVNHDDRQFNPTLMQPGMVFTVEPMINLKSPNATILEDKWTAVTEDGALSAQFEHTLVVTESGVEVLTR